MLTASKIISTNLKVLQKHNMNEIEQLETELTEFNIRESISEVTNFFVSSAEAKKNIFKTKDSPNLPELVYTD